MPSNTSLHFMQLSLLPMTYRLLPILFIGVIAAHAGVLDEEGGGASKPAPAAASSVSPPNSLQPSASQPTSAPSATSPTVQQPNSPTASAVPVAVPSAPASTPNSLQPKPLEPSSAVAPSEKAVPSEQSPNSLQSKKLQSKSKAPTTDLSSVPDASSVSSPNSLQSKQLQPARAEGASSDPYVCLAQALAQASGGNGKVNVGVGNFLYEDTDMLSPYSSMLKDELSMALPKAGKFEVITRERLADLQNEGKFQAKDIVEPGTEAKKVQIEGVQGIVRGRFYYKPPNLTIYAEIAYLDGGEIRKVKTIIPTSEVAARIWPTDTGKQSQPEVAIAPQAVKESTASQAEVESRVKKVNKDFDLQITTTDGKRGYAEGETVSFRVRANHDCYIAVIDNQIDGTGILLFPNGFNSENYLPAGKAIDVPGTVKHGFEIQISPPFGSDVVQVIACTRKEDLQKVLSAFPSSTAQNPYTTVRTRGMKVVAAEEGAKNVSLDSQPAQWSEDHIVVSTYPKVN